MSQHTVHIEMNATPETLERVLRLTRHRGFTICNMEMKSQGTDSSMDVTVESDRPIYLLTKQLDKLFDVTHCTLACNLQSQTAHG